MPTAFETCVVNTLKTNNQNLGKERLSRMKTKFEGLRDEHLIDGLPQQVAEFEAGQKVLAEYQIEIGERKRRELARLKWTKEAYDRVSQQTSTSGLAANAKSFIESAGGDGQTGMAYANTYRSIRALATARLDEILFRLGPNLLGFRGKGRVTAETTFVKEIANPGSTGDALASAMARSWEQFTDEMYRLFRLSGGSLSKLDGFWFPQKHSTARLLQAGESGFVEYHMRAGVLDWDRIRHTETGRRIRGDAERRAFLSSVYKTKTTDGAWKGIETQSRNRASVGNKIDHHRVLLYADANQWHAAHKQFGEGSVYDVVVDYINQMSHEIGLMSAFGPSPEWGKDYIIAASRNQATKIAPGGMPVQRVESQLRKFEDMFDMITRKNTAPQAGVAGATAHGLASLRQMTSGAFLGNTSLLAIPGDLMGTGQQVARMSKLSVMRLVGSYAKMMNPLSGADRALARQSAAIGELMLDTNFGTQRLNSIETYGSQFARGFSGFVMRTGLLSPHTQAVRFAAHMEFMGLLARSKNVPFNKHPMRNTMQRYGLSEADWDEFRALQTYDSGGAKFLRPLDALDQMSDSAKAFDLYRKWNGMMLSEAEKMAPDAMIESAATLKGSTAPGTLNGEILRSFAMFKNFPLTIYYIHARNMMAQKGLAGKVWYATTFLLGMWGAGILGEQMKQVAAGKDPKEMNPINPDGSMNVEALKLYGEGFMTGGGLGIWGDFIFKDVNEYGRGAPEMIAGPVVSVLDEAVRKLAIGNIFEAVQGKDTNAAREVADFAYRMLLPDSWWNATILRRAFEDLVISELDPKAHSKWRKVQTETRKSYDQEFWWPQGQVAPNRSPDMGAVLK